MEQHLYCFLAGFSGEHTRKESPLKLRVYLPLITERAIITRLIIGPLAHPVERIHGMDEASGSSPLGSTSVDTIKATAMWLLLCPACKQLCLHAGVEVAGMF